MSHLAFYSQKQTFTMLLFWKFATLGKQILTKKATTFVSKVDFFLFCLKVQFAVIYCCKYLILSLTSSLLTALDIDSSLLSTRAKKQKSININLTKNKDFNDLITKKGTASDTHLFLSRLKRNKNLLWRVVYM
jgi:hypothetical protein